MYCLNMRTLRLFFLVKICSNVRQFEKKFCLSFKKKRPKVLFETSTHSVYILCGVQQLAMHKYTTEYKLLRELVSIKRAQWSSMFSFLSCFAILVGISCYGASVANTQINAISNSVAAQYHSQNVLRQKIVEAIRNSEVDKNNPTEFYFSLTTRYQNVMLKVNTFAQSAAKYNDKENVNGLAAPPPTYFDNLLINVPASPDYAGYLRNVTKAPIINNVFLFAGGHGLGKSYAAVQLGYLLNRFANAVVIISMPMTSSINENFLNDIGGILDTIESALQKNCYIVWAFDELDTYLVQRRQDYQEKTLTQFAEYTGFVANKNRVLIFTMNNYELLAHNYWQDEMSIKNTTIEYKYIKDFRKALGYTKLSENQFLQEGQLSRLYSFIGNKLFVYKPFDKTAAQLFAQKYLKTHNIEWNDKIEKRLFSNNSTTVTYTVRTLKIAMDDIINYDK
ncbi:orf105 [Sucra jujuba nucleopolyhedrovirus]|uniref:Orf105 n=1 Tax=Sucra jujuba nucleopolyhedrovirus TaxID=1563660 RepID=A0A097P962_9ABAC|nr:orf105 [Sucra jujuba nucleopolyhedrovirus]AIU41344.1 orf105 [Sucra jujuba nucleopolyhedrovirus]